MRATEHNDYVDYLNSQLSVLRQYITLPADTAQQMLDIFSMPAPVVKGSCNLPLQHHYHSPFDLGSESHLRVYSNPKLSSEISEKELKRSWEYLGDLRNCWFPKVAEQTTGHAWSHSNNF